MNERAGRTPRLILPAEVAALLGLSEPATMELARAGYLGAAAAEERFSVGEVKAFQARVANHPAGAGDPPASALDAAFGSDLADLDPAVLLDALDGRAEEMAGRASEVYRTAFPQYARGWSAVEELRFTEQARQRFEAILAITAQGGDDELVADLAEVGSNAAWAGSSLPQLLIVLRISRDIVVQTAVEVAEEHGRHWGLALSLLLTRILPAMDRMTDAIAGGYWEAVVAREEAARSRHGSVVANASDGVYELDVDGAVEYANSAFAVIVGLAMDEIVGRPISEVLVPAEAGMDIEPLLRTDDGEWHHELSVRRPDGVCRTVQIVSTASRRGAESVGLQGIVRDLTVATELERQKNEFLAFVTLELRQPLTTILGLGATLEIHGDELPADRLRGIGGSIRRQGERVSRLADDLHDLSRIEAQSLQLTARPVRLGEVVSAALFSVPGSARVTTDVDPTIEVLVDPRRLEQVLANLVENALVHGADPVRVKATLDDDLVTIAVLDAGSGLPVGAVEWAFTRLHTASAGMGLSLVRGLVEAMGGRARYERGPDGPTMFCVTVPTPSRVGSRS